MVEAERENNVPLIIHILSDLFQGTANRNNKLAVSQQQQRHPPQTAKAFSGQVRPTISIHRYLERIFYNTDCSSCCYAIAFIYVDRFLHLNPSVTIDSFNAHRFLITAILTSVKFMDGSNYGNPHFANMGGISVSEMNELEVDFLFGLRFNLNVKPTTYNGYCSFLLGQMNIKIPRISQLVLASSEEEENRQNK